jgi:hypothetical protein
MIIKDIRVTQTANAITLSAHCKIRKIGWDEVYFQLTGADKADYIYKDASPFAAALLIPAMRQGENLIIHGSISQQLYDGMHRIMDELLSWNIGLERITVKADRLIADKQHAVRTASFFTGGVDSFYTYLKHKKDPMKAHRVDSFILANGFDIGFRETELWDLTVQNISSIAEAERVELLLVKSNIREVVEPMLLGDNGWEYPWDFIHGGCLAAIGLLLRNKYHRIYIASTHSAAQQIPWGSNLALDGLWSTEKLAFVHDGTEATRLSKVITQIAKSPVALQHLRVCYINKSGAYNCGQCDKCLRTMVNLYIADVLEQAATFPNKIDLGLLASVPTISDEHGGPIFHRENLQALRDKKLSPELQAALLASLNITAARPSVSARLKRQIIHRVAFRVAYADHAYAKGRLRIYPRISGLI